MTTPTLRDPFPDILGRPIQESARMAALYWLREIERRNAKAQLPSSRAVERLQVTLREHKQFLGNAVGNKEKKLLRKILATLQDIHQANTWAAWLEAESGRLPEETEAILRRLRARGRSDGSNVEGLRVALNNQFSRVNTGLAESLSTFCVCRPVGQDSESFEPYGTFLVARLRRRERRLNEVLPTPDSVPGTMAVARIQRELVRIQTLLLPLADLDPAIAEWCDHAARGESVITALGNAESVLQRARATGVRALLPSARANLLSHQSALTGVWISRTPNALRKAVDAISNLVQHYAPGSPRDASDLPLEIERKFLLRECPPSARSIEPSRIEQGWLPGKIIKERLRRLTRPDGRVICFRTIKYGRLQSRVELEEETPGDLFDLLWPLTRQARVRKHRHTVSEGHRHWEIDVFDDRDLVLAELELKSEDEKFAVPSWLAPYIVREVTGEKAYLNTELARPDV